ncbi:unnamed protein product [Ilex paraguariensis]|uniref:Myb-like domain-containing protein n=2 Tax=Ilex paraguariensis TaxID=185542 RepID=A0ABC8S2P3_9AQUA
MANQGDNNVLRDYRKGNWAIQETMVLIEAKKMDDERRMKRQEDSHGRAKPAELRWKWVEDYCWRNGCLRSQNQCNDKWDNLMRDFKKVRDYERRVGERGGGEERSYWIIERSERKEKNLPSNMLPEIYEALVEVVDRKVSPRVACGGSGGGGGGDGSGPSGSNSLMAYIGERVTVNVQPSQPPLLQQPITAPVAVLSLPLPPPPQSPAQPPGLPYSQPLPTPSDSDTSEYSDSPAKRRRGEGTSGGGAASGGISQEVGSAISKSASIIAEAIQASEEREERRHKELLSLHERRLQIEESKAEINRQGISGLVDSINKLANSILALAANKNQNSPK